MNKKLKKKKGFTLIELIIVIAILGILALIAIPKFGSAQKDAKIKADIATGKTIADTTATLVAKGELKAGTDYKELKDIGNNIYDKMNGFTAETKSQLSNETFKVKIDDDGNVEVYVGTDQVYPKHEGKYLKEEKE